jgi:superfamily II DNA/RNA helicase
MLLFGSIFIVCSQVLILAPTYELACQTGDVIMKMAKYMLSVRITYAIRGEKCKLTIFISPGLT